MKLTSPACRPSKQTEPPVQNPREKDAVPVRKRKTGQRMPLCEKAVVQIVVPVNSRITHPYASENPPNKIPPKESHRQAYLPGRGGFGEAD
jgi:hypothetical protein